MRLATLPPITRTRNPQTTNSIPIIIQAKGPADFNKRLASYGEPLNAMYNVCENKDAPNHTNTAYQHMVDSCQSFR